MPNRDDVIKMARKAGISEQISLSDSRLLALERFAQLVAAHERESIAREYESQPYMEHFGDSVAADLRARGNA